MSRALWGRPITTESPLVGEALLGLRFPPPRWHSHVAGKLLLAVDWGLSWAAGWGLGSLLQRFLDVVPTNCLGSFTAWWLDSQSECSRNQNQLHCLPWSSPHAASLLPPSVCGVSHRGLSMFKQRESRTQFMMREVSTSHCKKRRAGGMKTLLWAFLENAPCCQGYWKECKEGRLYNVVPGLGFRTLDLTVLNGLLLLWGN